MYVLLSSSGIPEGTFTFFRKATEWIQRLIKSNVCFTHATQIYVFVFQAGTDWLLSTAMWVHEADLDEVFQAAHYMAEAASSAAMFVLSDWEDIAVEREEAADILFQKIHFHKQVPVGLGSGQGSVEHKLRALAHKTMIECTSLDSAHKTFGRIRSLTVDMGTELGVAEAGGINITDVLPPWMSNAAGQRMHADAVEAGGEDVEANDEFIMQRALLVPGTCHILHNLQSDVDTVLQGWGEWLPGCKAPAHLIHHGHLRTRFIAHLIRNTRFAAFEPLYKHGCPIHATWRWGTLAGILKKFLYLQASLRCVWDARTFLDGPRSAADAAAGRPRAQLDDQDRQALNVHVLTRSIRSSKWWSYTEMLAALHEVNTLAGQWAESCPCHWWLRSLGIDENKKPEYSSAANMLMECRATQAQRHISLNTRYMYFFYSFQMYHDAYIYKILKQKSRP